MLASELAEQLLKTPDAVVVFDNREEGEGYEIIRGIKVQDGTIYDEQKEKGIYNPFWDNEPPDQKYADYWKKKEDRQAVVLHS